MNIRDLVYDVIVEEVKNKKQFAFLVKKWYGDTPSVEQIRRAETNLDLFFEKQKSITVTNPAVISFLHRWNATHRLGVKVPDLDNNGVQKQNNGQPMFKLVPFNFDGLKDPGRFTLEQFEDFLDEFRDATLTDDDDGEDPAFKGKLNATPEKINASLKLWLSDHQTVVSGEGFKVHKVPDAREAIKYGFYQQEMTKKVGGAQWCVTGRNTSDSRGNMWGTYRPKRTFWFVIDESKNPKDNKEPNVYRYYLSALQYCENDSNPNTGERYTGFKITSMVNDGDNPMTWEQVISIYPQLAEHRDLFRYETYDEGELLDRDAISRINENEGNRYEFAAQRKDLKKAYIDRGGVISTSKSWSSMDPNLRVLYIISTTIGSVIDKFKSHDLMSEIRKVGSEFKLLDNHLKSLGSRMDAAARNRYSDLNQLDLVGVGVIFEKIKSDEFKPARASLDNPQIKLVKSEKNKKNFGLYNYYTNDWVTHDGVSYESPYNEYSTIQYVDDNGEYYLVEIYVRGNGGIDDTTLYSVFPVNDVNNNGESHFIGARKWKELSSKLHPKDEDDDNPDMERITDFDPETDSDIKEIY
jgi:hypothetical protein